MEILKKCIGYCILATVLTLRSLSRAWLRLWMRPRSQPPKPYIHRPPSYLDSVCDAKRLSLTRAPSLEQISVIPKHPAPSPRASLLTLPAEVRKMIWKYALGGHTIHLAFEKKNLEYPDRWKAYLIGRKCLASDPTTCSKYWGGCNPIQLPPYGPPILSPPFIDTGLLSLLMVCKQIYKEAIDILYSSNTFLMNASLEGWGLLLLPFALLPHRLNAIRSLRLHFDLYCHPPLPVPFVFDGLSYKGPVDANNRQIKWETIWRIVSEMEGLEDLEVELATLRDWGMLSREAADILLAPIKQVTRPKRFILILPFEEMLEEMTSVNWPRYGPTRGWPGSDPWNDLSCTIRRMEYKRS
ncbi:hypothetical protein F5884DRAFT_743467 [Xylogone sp. PMI_703]|nr:hypothetical protein F5884DRAFT_743467 [Xylogone sp. PMI_703]